MQITLKKDKYNLYKKNKKKQNSTKKTHHKKF